jgi:hypothetical protein
MYRQPDEFYISENENESDSSLYESDIISDEEDDIVEKTINVSYKDGIGDDEFKQILDSALNEISVERLVLNFSGTAIRDGSIDYLINKLESLGNSALSNIYLCMRDVFITDAAVNKLTEHLKENHETLLHEIDLSSNNNITYSAINALLNAAFLNPKANYLCLENLAIGSNLFDFFLGSLQQIEKPRENKLIIEFGQTVESSSYIDRLRQEAIEHNIQINCICPPGR